VVQYEEEEEEEEEDTNSASEMGLVESGDDGGSCDVSENGDNPLLDSDMIEIPDTQPDAPESPEPLDSQPVDDSCPLMDDNESQPDCTIGYEEEAGARLRRRRRRRKSFVQKTKLCHMNPKEL
jgi:hypothetical protein